MNAPARTAPLYRGIEQHTGRPSEFFTALQQANDNLESLAELRKAVADRDSEVATLNEIIRCNGKTMAKLADTVFEYRAKFDQAAAERDELQARLDEVIP